MLRVLFPEKMTELITGNQLQSHLAKKRKYEAKEKKGLVKKKSVVRPGCKKSKWNKTDSVSSKNEEQQDLRLLNYPSVEKIVTPIVSTQIQTQTGHNKQVLVIDFNRPPYMDTRFRFVGYSMVFLSRHVKHLATALCMAANVLKDVVPIFFDSEGIRIKKCEYDGTTKESFIFQVRFHNLLQYYCHTPMAFLIHSLHANRFAKRHSNQGGECSAIWKFNRDNRIRIHLINDDKNLYKNYTIPVMRTLDTMVETPPLGEDELSWDMELEEVSKSCDELNACGHKDPTMTFRIWRNAIEIFVEKNETENHIFGMHPEEQPVPENLQFTFHLSLNSLKKEVCSRMKKSKGQDKTLTICVDSNPESYVHFSQHLSDQITFEWWLPKRHYL